MSNNVRIAGILAASVALALVLILRPDLPEAWGALLAILAGLVGAPTAVQKLKARLATPEGNKLTWDEIHAVLMGLGDGLGLNKPEKPTEDFYKAGDYRDIILREAWYYKVPFAVGRLAWVPIIYYSVLGVIRAISSAI